MFGTKKKLFFKKSTCHKQFDKHFWHNQKPDDPIPRKHLDRCQDWQTGKFYFIEPFWLLPGDPTSTTAVDWHLKVEDIKNNAVLTKNYYITISIQKLSWIHNFILKTQQISGSHDLNDHTHFWPCPHKNHWIKF